MVHETLSTGDTCSSSVSQVFAMPVPAAYYRAFWPRLSLFGEDVGMCSWMVEALVKLGSKTRVPPAPAEAAKAAGEEFAKQVDANGDGKISKSEITAVNTERTGRIGTLTLAELVAFHDVDGDGEVTTQEVVDSWVMYAASQFRVNLQNRQRGEL